MSQQSSRGATLRIGALLGVGWGIVLIVNSLFGALVPTVITAFVSLILFFVAGLLAAKRTGKVSSGLLAGFYLGLISSLLNNIVVFIVLLGDPATINQVRQAAQQAVNQNGLQFHYTNNLILIVVGVAMVLLALISGLFGLIVGVFGGLAGRARAPITPPTYGNWPPVPPGSYGAPGYPQYPQYPPARMPDAAVPPPTGEAAPIGSAYPPVQSYAPPAMYPPPPELYAPESSTAPTQPAPMPPQPPEGQ